MDIVATHDNTLKLIDDWAWFNALAHNSQKSILNKLTSIAQIRSAPRGQKDSAKKRESQRREVSIATINREVRRFRTGGVKALADQRGSTHGGLPPAFVSWVKGLFDSHQRADDGKEVHRVILTRLTQAERGGQSIPGYPAPPRRNPSTGVPDGWSYENIIRKCKPRHYVAAATKIGPKAAANYLPPVLTTRLGSRALSRILFDDQDLDNLLADGQLALSGIKETQRPVSFNALDFYTASHIGHHLRAIYKSPDDQKNKTLTGKEFVWFVIHILQTVGFRTDDIGTELIFEHGTANTWANQKLTSLGGHHSFEDAIAAILGGSVTVNRSGKFNTPLFADMYFRPQSTGNFRFKTWIESSFRLLRTWMQTLPGATGHNQRLNGPEELHGIKHREQQLLTAIADKLPPEHRDLIQHTLLSFTQFHELVCSVYRAVNRRTDHQLEGWSQCGWTFPVWRPSLPAPGEPDHWFSWSELEQIQDPTKKELLLSRINANRSQLIGEQKLSPADALDIELQRDQQHIRKLSDKVASLLLPREWAIECKVASDHTIQLTNPLWTDSKDTYICSITEDGRRWTLEAGKKLLVFHNPFSDGRAHLHNEHGAYLGTVHPVVKAQPFDPQSYLAQLGTRSAVKSGHDTEIKSRMADVAAQRQSRERANDQLIKSGKSPAQRRSEAAHRAASTRRAEAWSDPESSALAAAAIEPDDSNHDQSPISTDDISAWLED